MRKKKNKISFIDNERYFSRWERKKKGDVVTYKRLSDDETSIGTIRWFEIDKTEKVVVTLIDSFLQNFQSCYFDDIVDNPDPKTSQKLKKKLKGGRQ